jgi:hypothetical protein
MFNKDEKPTAQKRPEKHKPEDASRIAYKDKRKLDTMGKDDNFEYRVVNSDDSRYAGRVEDLKARGYTVCTQEEMGESVGVEASSIGSVTSRPVGHGVKGILMKIPKKYYQEDQRQKQSEVDTSEAGMVDESLLKANDTYGEGLKVDRKKPTVNIQQN